MGQSGYAENFVNLMLGWVRQLASSVAGMFQSTGGGQSGGRMLLNWFSDHWLGLLIALIVVGVLADWIVWMLRWRPYWLWFRKRRILLDDDIDEELSEEQLLSRYGMRDEAPRFHSSALPREDEEYDAYEPYDDGQDDEGYEAYVEDVPDDEEQPWDEYEEADQQPYEEPEPPEEERLPISDGDDEWDDLPPKKAKARRLFGRKRRDEDEDPFAVDEKDFHGLDDDFFDVVSEEPHPEADEDLRIYARPSDRGMDPLDDEAGEGDFDERIGYQSSFEPLTGTARSRRSRRRNRDEQED